MARIWGFDLGTASIGFAVIEHDEANSEGNILKLGVRVFPEGVEEKRKEPRNLARRQARLMRRQIRRRRWRKRHLRVALADAGLLPREEAHPSPQATEFFSSLNDPYELRAKGVNEKLEPHEIGRALFHLSKHRAFVGSRKFGEVEEREPGKLRRKAQQLLEGLEKEIERGNKEAQAGEKDDEEAIKPEIELHKAKMGRRSLGEYLRQNFQAPKRKRGWHFHRDMVEDEFDRLWNKQSEFHPALLTEKQRERIRTIMFFQRPTFFRMSTVGKCELEPGEDRCLKADWHAQRFAMLQKLNDLRLSDGRPLNADQRDAILRRIEAKAKVTFKSLRKALKLDDEVFNFELGGDKEMLGNATEQKLADVFGAQWDALAARDKIRDEIAGRLWRLEYRTVGNKRAEIRDWKEIAAERDRFCQEAQRDWNITAEQAKALSELSLPDGHAMHSKRAILKMLPYMEGGLGYYDAKAKAYPADPPANHDPLPPPDRRTGGWRHDIRNPTVMRVLQELRNVAKNLLRVYGPPDLIRVELARDLKMPRQDRLDLIRSQRNNEEQRKKARDWLAERAIQDSGLNVEKYLLAEQQGWRCPYTGAQITCEGLFQTGLFQVDHILPRARSLDNSFANKVVCHRDANDEKAKRTPYEAWGKDPDKWAAIGKFLDDTLKYTQKNPLPFTRGKAERIKTPNYPALGSDEFTERQLRDTAYASRLARNYLATLGVRVEPANGRVTGVLRQLWGLNEILSDSPAKSRDDHRHHAVDALAVALTSPAFIKRASESYAAGDLYQGSERSKKQFEQPWKTLHADAERAVGEIIVSHRAQRKVSGALHDEMPWGDTGREVEKSRITYRIYAQRKDKKRVEQPMQRSLMRAVGPDKGAWVATNSNHHMVVYKDAAGKFKYQVVSMFDAAMRIAQRKPAIDREPELGATCVRSLCIGDTLQAEIDGKKDHWIVKKIPSNGQITVQPHNAAQDLGRTSPIVTKLFREGARKVVVDPIGRVFPAND